MMLLPGFRFVPTDDELITHYLHKKINGEPFPTDFVIERDLYGMSPWKVFNNPSDPWQTSKVTNKAGLVKTDRVIYVITKLKKASECRISRVAGCGVWHGEGGPYDIKDDNGVVIGTEKTYSFQVTDESQERIPEGHWIMHEISARAGTEINNNNYVICKISRDDTKPPRIKNKKESTSAKRARPSTNSLGEEDLQRKKLKMNNQEAKENQPTGDGSSNTHTNEAAAQVEATEDKNNNVASATEFDAPLDAKEDNNNNNNNVACNDDQDEDDTFAADIEAELEQEEEEEEEEEEETNNNKNNNNNIAPCTQLENNLGDEAGYDRTDDVESVLKYEDLDFSEELSNLGRLFWTEESDKQMMSNAMQHAWIEFDKQMRLLEDYQAVDWTN